VNRYRRDRAVRRHGGTLPPAADGMVVGKERGSTTFLLLIEHST